MESAHHCRPVPVARVDDRHPVDARRVAALSADSDRSGQVGRDRRMGHRARPDTVRPARQGRRGLPDRAARQDRDAFLDETASRDDR